MTPKTPAAMYVGVLLFGSAGLVVVVVIGCGVVNGSWPLHRGMWIGSTFASSSYPLLLLLLLLARLPVIALQPRAAYAVKVEYDNDAGCVDECPRPSPPPPLSFVAKGRDGG